MNNYQKYATLEFKAAGWDLEKEPIQKSICDQIMKLLEVFGQQGHSGTTAPYTVEVFSRLALFKPLTPLTGEDWEWNEMDKGVFQNRRCSHVFKQPDRFNGQAYDMEGVIFEDRDGCRFINSESAVPIVFPYTPTRKYVKLDKEVTN